jgi:hypothetical protein
MFLPKSTSLYQNYPNPFNPTTNIRFKLNITETVFIKVYDILGKEVKLLVRKKSSFRMNTIFNGMGKDNKGNTLTGGIYFIQMQCW